MRVHRLQSLTLIVVLAAVCGSPVLAQSTRDDSVRVLRFQPDSDATPVAPVVVTFDRPVAPLLEKSIDPRGLLRVIPSRDAIISWRDPSTIVVRFPTPWMPGATYQVALEPFRDASGHAFARRAPWRVNVQRARLVHIGAPPERQASPVPVDPLPVLYAVYSGAVTADQIAGRARIWGHEPCQRRDTLALEVSSITRLGADTPKWLRDVGPYDRDRRLDSLRHVVTLRSPGQYPRGCRLEVTTPTEAGAAKTTPLYLEVRPPLRVGILTRGEGEPTHCARGCNGGPLTLSFSRAITGDELRRTVRIDGHPPVIAGNAAEYEWTLRDSVPMGRALRVQIDEDLRAPDGDRLGRAIDTLLERNTRAIELGYPNSEVHVPRSSHRLLRMRVAYADSLVVVIARVPDSLRGRALLHGDAELGRIAEWMDLASDSVVRIVPVVSSTSEERIVDVTLSHVPPAWRQDALLVVHATPGTRPTVPRPPQSSERLRPGTGVQVLTAMEVNARYDGQQRQPMYALVQRTDLVAHAAQRGRSLVVWVTDRASAKPIAGARVRVFKGARRLVASAVSDSTGLAELRMSERAYAGNGEGSHYVEVSQGSDCLLLGLPQEMWMRTQEPRDTGDAMVEAPLERMHGGAFTDRDIYRPGERVYLKGIARVFRAAAGYVTPTGDSARWTIAFVSAPGGPVHVQNGSLGAFGTSVDSFQIASTARVGTYSVVFEVRRPEGWTNVAERWFQVAEYRVPEFAVTLSHDSTVRVYAGDTATIRVAGRYLFGPTMAESKVTATVNVSPMDDEAAEIDALRQYSVGRPLLWTSRDPSLQYANYVQNAELDASGASMLHLPVPKIAGAGRMSVSVTVQDVNRQTVAATTVLPVRAASIQVGVRVPRRRWLWTTRDSIPVDILVADRTGAVLRGQQVTITALRVTWQGATWHPDTVWRSEVRSGSEPASATFAPTTSGWYEVLASARDDHGRMTESAVTLYVWGAPNDPSRNPSRFTVRTERHRYSAGDSAVVLIDAPTDLSAIVTIRREFLLARRAVTLKQGANAIPIPVPTTAIGGAIIDVTAARPLGAQAMVEGSSPQHLRESVEIAVSDSARALRVRLRPERNRYAPGDSVRLDLEVLDPGGRGRRSEAAVWAVDEGVLSLSGYFTPDVLSLLVSRPYEWERTSSTLRALLSAVAPSVGPVYYHKWRGFVSHLTAARASDGGGFSGGVRPGDPVRHRFITTPFYAGNVLTDSTGRARLAFVLPHNATTYRIFAAVVGDADVWAGADDTTIVSAPPLVVRAALPRALRRGDSLYAGAVITREGSAAATPVTLTVHTDGARVEGPSTVRDSLHGGARERRFAMRVDAEDSVGIGFSAQAPDAGDAVMVHLPVAPAGRPRAHVAMGALKGEGSVELELPDGIDVERSRLVLRSGHSPLPLVRELDARLRVYPYACTEQIASAARALIARVRLERALGYRFTMSPEDRTRLETAVYALLDRQRNDGAFGYWSRSHWSTPWLTSHALEALLGAHELGIPVPRSALDRAAKYFGVDATGGPDVREYLRDLLRARWLAAGDSIWWPHEALHAARLLRKIGQPDTTLEQKVWRLRAKLDYQNRLVLAQLRAAGGDSAGARSLLDDAWRSVRVEGRRMVVDDSVVRRVWIFRSVTGTYTELLRATAALRPAHPGLAPLLESVLQSARSDASARWNTVDQAALAEAIQSAIVPLGMRDATRLVVRDARGGSTTRDVVPTSGDSLSLDLSRYVVGGRGGRKLQVHLASSATAPMYYALTLLEVPLARPTRPDQEGIAVERWYERYEDGAPITDVQEGALVRVRLRITAPRDREFVVIDDPLPAGLEAVDQSLRTTGSLPPYEGAPRLEGDLREGPVGQKWLYGSWDGGWWTPWEHKEIRDDRVLWFARQLWRGSYQASYVARATTAGLFVRPPAQAEEMYNPAVHGRSEGGVFSVRSSEPAAKTH